MRARIYSHRPCKFKLNKKKIFLLTYLKKIKYNELKFDSFKEFISCFFNLLFYCLDNNHKNK